MINFDNSAGTYPKPEAVRRAVSYAMRELGGNPGRGGHRLSVRAAEEVWRVRQEAGAFFGAEPENVAFTPNCTFALNMAIKGIMQSGGHIIISDMEHNACARPVYALTKRGGVSCGILHIHERVEDTLAELEGLIRPDTLCVCCMAASNVTGRILPFREIARVCRERHICMIVDGAQAAGTLELSVGEGISFLALSGQKGLYGPTGTGLLISSGEFGLSTIIEGGTGSSSESLEQPAHSPERFESGSINVSGIVGLGAGLRFVRSRGPARLREHSAALCRQVEKALHTAGAEIYDEPFERTPIVAFGIPGRSSEEISAALNSEGFALRGGLHCAALAHQRLGTLSRGAVRFSPSAFNTMEQTQQLCKILCKITT